MITYQVGTRGLEDCLDNSLIYTNAQFYSEENLPANVSWEEVTVSSEEDMDKWLQAKNRWLQAAWTPNQSHNEREENSLIMKQQNDIMSSLEINKYFDSIKAAKCYSSKRRNHAISILSSVLVRNHYSCQRNCVSPAR